MPIGVLCLIFSIILVLVITFFKRKLRNFQAQLDQVLASIGGMDSPRSVRYDITNVEDVSEIPKYVYSQRYFHYDGGIFGHRFFGIDFENYVEVPRESSLYKKLVAELKRLEG